MSKRTIGRRHLRRALKILTHRDPVDDTLGAKGNIEAFRRDAATWLFQPGIEGVGIARRRRKGELLQDLALKVYVTKKLPLSKCRHIIPPKLHVPMAGFTIETDVEEVGEIRLHGNTGLARPVVPGFGISPQIGGAGTIGCFVRKTSAPNDVFLLGAGHTFLFGRSGSIGDPLFQPAREDDPSGSLHRIAVVVSAVDLDFVANGFPNLCDVAIARLDPGVPWSPEIPRIGIPSAVFTNLRTGMRVRMNGRTSGLAEGKIVDIDFHKAFPVRTKDGTDRLAGFRAQVLCTHYAEPGDSGAAVVTTGGMLVGFHLGGSNSHGVFSRALPALRSLGVDLVTGQ